MKIKKKHSLRKCWKLWLRVIILDFTLLFADCVKSDQKGLSVLFFAEYLKWHVLGDKCFGSPDINRCSVGSGYWLFPYSKWNFLKFMCIQRHTQWPLCWDFFLSRVCFKLNPVAFIMKGTLYFIYATQYSVLWLHPDICRPCVSGSG